MTVVFPQSVDFNSNSYTHCAGTNFRIGLGGPSTCILEVCIKETESYTAKPGRNIPSKQHSPLRFESQKKK